MALAQILIVFLLITKLNNSTILLVIKVSFARNMKILGKMLLIQIINFLLSRFVLMENFVLLLITNPKFHSSWYTRCKKIYNFIYMLIRQFGVQSQHSTIDPSVFMLTIFKIIEEIPRITTISPFNVHFGRKTRILKT